MLAGGSAASGSWEDAGGLPVRGKGEDARGCPYLFQTIRGREVVRARPCNVHPDPLLLQVSRMLPLSLACAVFSSHLMTADLDEFYRYE